MEKRGQIPNKLVLTILAVSLWIILLIVLFHKPISNFTGTTVDANGDGTTETASDLAWHRQMFLDSGMKYIRDSSGITSHYSFGWKNLDFEVWTNSSVGLFSNAVDSGTSSGSGGGGGGGGSIFTITRVNQTNQTIQNATAPGNETSSGNETFPEETNNQGLLSRITGAVVGAGTAAQIGIILLIIALILAAYFAVRYFGAKEAV